MTRYRKLPVEISAIQFTRDTFRAAVRFIPLDQFSEAGEDDQGLFLAIRTLEGVMRATEGDWIIQGVKGEYYPCKPDVFAATYEAVEEQDGQAVSTAGQPLVTRAVVYRELADLQDATAATEAIRRRRSNATVRRLLAIELRRMADNASRAAEGAGA
ncbi:hypothetical protein [Streptomyces goshikiensis]|uniref:hypothetical protein n=1 Tax=Streptomyces goshikiensis TaxID=1942 RepID=UPI003674FEF6